MYSCGTYITLGECKSPGTTRDRSGQMFIRTDLIDIWIKLLDQSTSGPDLLDSGTVTREYLKD
jgi:hypothetical protein